MRMLGKAHADVVKVMRALSPDGATLPATVYARGGKFAQQLFLSPEAREQLGPDIFAYFEAERVAGQWWLGQRLPDSPVRRW